MANVKQNKKMKFLWKNYYRLNGHFKLNIDKTN